MSVAGGSGERAAQLVRSSAAVATGTLLSRVTGLLRVGVLTYALGRATLADAYNLANTTPNIVYELLLGGVLTATLVPLFVEHLRDDDERATQAVLTVAMTALVALTAVAVVAAPWIARLYSIGTGSEGAAQEAVMTDLLRWFMPQMCFYGLTALATAMLHARRRFLAAAYAPVLNNVVVVVVLLAFVRATDGPRSLWVDAQRIRGDDGLLLLLGLGTTAGIAAMALVLLPALRRAGARLRFVPDWRHPAVRTVLRLSGWTVGYVAANQAALLVVLVLANSGAAGSVSAYQYAFIFFQLPHGLFAVSIMTTTTPELARRAAAADLDGLRADFASGLRFLIAVVAPAATALAVLAQPAVAVLRRGGFGAEDVAVTADTLQVLALGLLPFSVFLFTLRGFYALQDTRTPFFVNLFENAVNVALAAALFSSLGVQGLAWAYAAAYGVAVVVALVALARRVGPLVTAPVRATAGRAAIGSLALAAVAVPLASAIGHTDPAEAAVATVVAAGAGAGAYVAVLGMLRADELRQAVASVRGRRGRNVSR